MKHCCQILRNLFCVTILSPSAKPFADYDSTPTPDDLPSPKDSRRGLDVHIFEDISERCYRRFGGPPVDLPYVDSSSITIQGDIPPRSLHLQVTRSIHCSVAGRANPSIPEWIERCRIPHVKNVRGLSFPT